MTRDPATVRLMDVAIYARLSQEDDPPKAGEPTATEQQIADCKARAASEGWNVVGVYEDPDVSASDPRRKRPEFERMLADLGDGVRVDRVVCWKLDRLLRQPKEAERIIELADERKFGIVSLSDPLVDLTSPNGRAMFRISITMAKAETETMSLRVRRKARSIAEAGRPNGGGIRSFGLTIDKESIVPEEAVLIREAADRVLAGESLHSVAVSWERRGIRTPAGRKWESSSLKRMLIAPRIAGDRVHHGVVVGTGVIPALLDRETYDRLCSVLVARSGRGAHPSVRRHFLTGLVYCGRCGQKLVARPDARGQTRYACPPLQGCGGIVVAKKNIEPMITAALIVRASKGFAKRSMTEDTSDDDLALLRDDQAALEEAATGYFVDRTISKVEYQTVRSRLEARIDATRRRLERSTSTAGRARLAGLNLAAEWDSWSAPRQHDVAALLIDRITVKPAPRRGTRFDPDRIDVEWKA
jgi:site-specific DNA recombinase